MRQCLTSSQGGYYTTTRSRDDAQAADQFGAEGDFITSPEISQVFGEMVGIWFVSEWLAQTQAQAQGRSGTGGSDGRKVHLIELGPGRGTLMDDVLRTVRNFGPLAQSVDAVYLVEASEGLRAKQCRLLCGDGVEMERTETGWKSQSTKYLDIPIVWVEDISLLPKHEDQEEDRIPFIVAHEFFDAMPIHAFESVAPAPLSTEAPKTELLDAAGRPIVRPSSASKQPQWREYLVTPTKKTTIKDSEMRTQPDFQLTLAKASTPTSLVMPESSERYRRLKSQPGSSIEISSESYRYIDDFARRIGGEASISSSSPPSRNPLQQVNTPASGCDPPKATSHRRRPAAGAALIIDYGPASTVPVNSLRGIRAHGRVSPFTSPGEVDISADVDFTALAEAAVAASVGVEVYGPVEQGAWLRQMGGTQRAQQLLLGVKEEDDGGGEKKRQMEMGWSRLVDGGPVGMGSVYKVLAVVPESGGRRRPVGFGGDVGPQCA